VLQALVVDGPHEDIRFQRLTGGAGVQQVLSSVVVAWEREREKEGDSERERGGAGGGGIEREREVSCASASPPHRLRFVARSGGAEKKRTRDAPFSISTRPHSSAGVPPNAVSAWRSDEFVKYVRGSKSNCEQDSRKM
jgi:hypothetical protein